MNTIPKKVKYHNGVHILSDGTFYAICTVCYGMGCETCHGVGEGYSISKLPTSFPADLLWEIEERETYDEWIDWQEIDETGD